MPGPSLPSLDLVLDEVRASRQAQANNFDGLDAKAGVVLGFSGAFVALVPDRVVPLIILGRIAAALGGLLALASFWPRTYWLTDARALRDRYLTAELAFTKLKLLDSTITEAAQVRRVLIRKTHFLRAAMVSLAAGVLCVAAAVT